MNIKNKNILELFLEQLKVKFTKSYASKLYVENPYNNSLFGMSKMLSDYNVENKAVRMHNKDEINSLEFPFMVNLDGNIALIHKLTKEEAYCYWRNQDINIPIGKFKNLWDGVVLLAEKTMKTVEPDYRDNLKNRLFKIVKKNVFVACIAILFLIGFISNDLHTNLGILLLLIANLTGGYIGYLLIQKQFYIQSNHADKICSLFKKNGCNSVLESSAAKFMGIIGWSEVGLSYFISNILITVLFPELISYLALINICALPYSLWSVWYQKYKTKQWCPLCLIVQVLLWLVFVVNLKFHNIVIPKFNITEILLTGIIYIIPFLVISFLLPNLNNEKQKQWIRRELNDLRTRPEIFETLLKKQPHYNVNLSTSNIIRGNKEANILITVVTNPHCGPCAEMHKNIEKFLEKIGDEVCVQYIFSSFNEKLESSSKFLAAIYLSDISQSKKQEIYNNWFDNGKYERERFFNKYNFDINSQIVESEINKHKQWNELNNIHATPTILINGYELPYNYRIEDLIYFTDVNI